MDVTITGEQWAAARAALADAGQRFADLVESATVPGALATEAWSIAETAAHVVGIASSYTVMVDPHSPPSAGYEFLDLAPGTTIHSVAELNRTALDAFAERDVVVLARGMRTAVAEILARSEGMDPATPIDWLGGSRVPVAGILAHLVNELLIHGGDIARAEGRAWAIPSWQAALFLELFLVGMVRTDPGEILDARNPPARRIAVEFRSRHTTTVTLVLRGGRLTAEGPGSDPDAIVSFEPAALNLMLFHRLGRLSAMCRGKVRVHGRRPWLLVPFMRVLRMP
ncbi:maleylpyruvate isomerase N-terminal domain-containing protein [Amycolatopsis sp. MtRt-6]|uniref:maleylpyruvate isomerase N-terminal domain-containing protein n=1 Tax=Amycolatopsis sp. MtRt-6 TaxID=2792782 RepID=UPI0027DE166B|nr:maleylpyruvate isomerase N-terminal domain-containing protein [Amycolatopsis sp. MtRt-6]